MRSSVTAPKAMRRMLPESDLRVAIAHDHRLPADQELAGGDVVAFDRHDDGSTTLLVADLSAQGSEGTNYAEWLASVFHLTCAFIARPSNILEQLNLMLSDASKTVDSGLTARAFVCRLFPRQAYLVYASAGAETPILLKGTGECFALTSGGLPLGTDANALYADSALHVDTRDAFVVYTDGVTSSHHPSSSRKLGVNGVMKAIAALERCETGPCPAEILNRVDEHNAGFYCDDATMVVASFRGYGE